MVSVRNILNRPDFPLNQFILRLNQMPSGSAGTEAIIVSCLERNISIFLCAKPSKYLSTIVLHPKISLTTPNQILNEVELLQICFHTICNTMQQSLWHRYYPHKYRDIVHTVNHMTSSPPELEHHKTLFYKYTTMSHRYLLPSQGPT